MKYKEVFKTKLDGKELELAILKPSPKDLKEAQKVYNKALREALEGGAILRVKLDDYLKEQGVWSDQDQKDVDEITEIINKGRMQLAKGGIKKSEAREIAINMRRKRFELIEKMSVKTSMANYTAEGHAEDARFHYLISVCTVDPETGNKYFKDVDDLLDDANEAVAVNAGRTLQSLVYGFDDSEAALPENKFLKEYGYVNDDLHLVDSDGNLIDTQGRRIRDDGRLIDDQGRLVDRDGNLVNEDGTLIVDFVPFLED